MTARLAHTTGVLLLSVVLPGAASAQQAGLPVDHSPAHLPVFGFHLDFGRGSGYAGTGTLRSLGGRLQLSFDDVQIIAGAHHVNPERDVFEPGLGVQGTVALRLLEPRPRRVANVQAGIGWLRLDATGGGDLTFIDIPIGVSIGAYLPTPLGPAEAWAAPRVQLRHVSQDVAGAADDDGTFLGGGGSVGLRFTLADAQAGFSIAVDGLALRDPVEDDWRLLGAFDLALHLLLLR